MSEEGEWLCRDCLVRQFARQTWKMRTWIGKMEKTDPIYIEAENYWRLLNDALLSLSVRRMHCAEKDIGKCREREPETLVRKGEFLKNLYDALQGYDSKEKDARLLDYDALRALANSEEGKEIVLTYQRYKTKKIAEMVKKEGER